MTSTLFSPVFTNIDKSMLFIPPSDTMWVDNIAIRKDYNLLTEEAKPLVDILTKEFPQYNIYDNIDTIIGGQESYRHPYSNYTISVYKFAVPDYNIAKVGRSNKIKPPYVEFLPWYGLKFDTEKKTIGTKLVFNDLAYIIPRPTGLPHSSRFFAQYYHSDGTPDSTLDCYFFASPIKVQELCDRYSLPFPCEDQRNDKFIYTGIVYNKEDLKVTTIKSYCTFDSLK